MLRENLSPGKTVGLPTSFSCVFVVSDFGGNKQFFIEVPILHIFSLHFHLAANMIFCVVCKMPRRILQIRNVTNPCKILWQNILLFSNVTRFFAVR